MEWEEGEGEEEEVLVERKSGGYDDAYDVGLGEAWSGRRAAIPHTDRYLA